jgi:MscS family membrane protein
VLLCRSFNALQTSPLVFKLAPAVGIIVFAVWGLGPLMRQSRNLLFHVCLPCLSL